MISRRAETETENRIIPSDTHGLLYMRYVAEMK